MNIQKYQQEILRGKQTITLLLIFISISLIGQKRDVSFSSVIPDLSVMPSGFNYNTDDAKKVPYIFHTNGSHATFIGGKITSSDLKDKLGANIINNINENKIYQKGVAVALKKLEIFADTLILDDHLWAPSCYIIIRAKVISLKKNEIIIKTSPLPWIKTVNTTLVDNNYYKGEDGFNAGDVTIFAEQVNQKLIVDLQGSDGEPVMAPEIKVIWPTTAPDRMEVHTCQGAQNQGKRSNQHDIGKDKKIICMKWWNFDYTLIKTNDCHSHQLWDNNMYWDGNKVVDNKASSRIEVGQSIWGRGGSAGNLITNIKNLLYYNSGGLSGYYLPKNQNDVSYTLDKAKRVTAIDVKRQKYTYNSIVTDSDVYGKVTLREPNELRDYMIPYEEEYNAFKRKYTLNYYQENGRQGAAKNLNYYVVHGSKLMYDLDNMAIRIKGYHQLNDDQKRMLDAQLTTLEKDINQFDKYAEYTLQITNENKIQLVNTMLNQWQYIVSHKGIDYDLYNNPLGYRPILSLQAAMTMMEKNLDNDLYLYIVGDSLFQQQSSGKIKMSTLEDTEQKLINQSKILNGELESNFSEYRVIQSMSESCSQGLDSLQKAIKSEVDKLEEKAKKDAKKRKMYAIGIKTIGIATSVIATAYGQPAVGAAAYSILNNVADGVEGDRKIEDIAIASVKNFDLKGVIQGYKDGKLMKIEKDKRKDELSGYEKKFTVADDILKPKYTDSITQAKKNIRNAFLKNFIIEKDKMKEYAKYMESMNVNIDYVNQKLDALKNNSSELRQLTIQAQNQIEKQSKLFESLSENLNRKLDILQHMCQNGEALYSIQEMRLNPEKIYQPDLYLLFQRMKEQALERLKWYEYTLVKTYEYTTLSTYNNGTKRNYFDQLMTTKRAAQPNITMAEMIRHLKTNYMGLTQDIKTLIINNTMPNNKQDANIKGKGRRIVLTPPYLTQLNEKRQLVLDLQADLNGEIIKPDQSNVRIISIELDEEVTKLDQLLKTDNDRFEIKLKLDDKSILRKNDQFYLFDDNNGKGNEQPRDIWTWTIQKGKSNNKVINFSEPSDYYKNLMKQALGVESNGSMQFTLHPAWTKAYLEIDQYTATETDINLSNLAFIMRCDYEYNDQSKNGKAIVDLKINQAPDGTMVNAQWGNVTTTTVTNNLYKIIPLNSKLTLEVISPSYNDGDPKKTFSHWQINGGEYNKADINNSKITITLNRNTEIYPIFK